MAISNAPVVLGMAAPEFELPATSGRMFNRTQIDGINGTVIAFICNHCPYVKAVIDRMVADAEALAAAGIGFAAICSNDAEAYPADSFENMKQFAKDHRFGFPYLLDDDQSVARAFNAACTPEFFGFDRDRKLVYHGRLDEGRTGPLPQGARRELLEAMTAVSENIALPFQPKPPLGCSIKWKPE